MKTHPSFEPFNSAPEAPDGEAHPCAAAALRQLKGEHTDRNPPGARLMETGTGNSPERGRAQSLADRDTCPL